MRGHVGRQQGYCEQHGPYDRLLYSACPYCAYERRQQRPHRATRWRRTVRQPTTYPNIRAEPLAYLIVKSPLVGRGDIYPVRNGYTIGRASNNRIILRHRQVAPYHLQIYLAEYRGRLAFVGRSLKPDQPAFLNGLPITRPTLLWQDNEISVGPYLFVFKTLY